MRAYKYTPVGPQGKIRFAAEYGSKTYGWRPGPYIHSMCFASFTIENSVWPLKQSSCSIHTKIFASADATDFFSSSPSPSPSVSSHFFSLKESHIACRRMNLCLCKWNVNKLRWMCDIQWHGYPTKPFIHLFTHRTALSLFGPTVGKTENTFFKSFAGLICTRIYGNFLF